MPAIASIQNPCAANATIRIQKLLTDTLLVPKTFQHILRKLPERLEYDEKTPPRFQATLAFGKLNEPWLTDIKPLP